MSIVTNTKKTSTTPRFEATQRKEQMMMSPLKDVRMSPKGAHSKKIRKSHQRNEHAGKKKRSCLARSASKDSTIESTEEKSGFS
jgi:hypothetical protein